MQRHAWYAAGIAATLLCACGPIGPFPGGALDGETGSRSVEDWSFSDDHKNIQLETAPADPYSVTLWCVAHEGQLYIAAARGAESTWAQNLLDDPSSKVRIDGTLYERRAVRVTDADEISQALDMFIAKYDFDLPSEEERKGAILFRMDSP